MFAAILIFVFPPQSVLVYLDGDIWNAAWKKSRCHLRAIQHIKRIDCISLITLFNYSFLE